MRPLRWLLLTISACAAVSHAAVPNSDARGLEIATQADRRDAGFGDTSAALTMTLFSSRGETTIRRMRARILETENGDKRLILFDEPGDVRGTAVLTHTHLDGSDDQWIYLPAIKRVKRIAATGKTGPFMGSEFAYEDLTAQEVARYSYTHLREEACPGGQCYVIERRPTNGDSGYLRQAVWIDEAEFRVWRVEYYDRKDELLKVLTFDDYGQYNDRYWRARIMTMENVQTGKRTVLEWSGYKFGNGLSAAAFDPARLSDSR
jgi:outer membrane lipoprotein-sorting protein